MGSSRTTIKQAVGSVIIIVAAGSACGIRAESSLILQEIFVSTTY